MMNNKRTLGRGLSELLSSVPSNAVLPAVTDAPPTPTIPSTLPIDILQPGKYQPRRDFNPEALQELADSIRMQGILQPLLVRPIANHRYEIIAGERRWRAAQLAALTEVPVFIREIPDEAAMAMGIIENIQREDLNAIEQAVALKRLGDEFGMTHEAIAAAVGKSRVMVSNLLRLLQLAPSVKTMVEKGQIDMGHARALLSLRNDQQIDAANTIVLRNLSVRETEDLVRKYSVPTASSATSSITKTDPDILRMQSQLSDKLGAQVVIQHAGNGKGKLVIQYYSLEEFEGIVERIR